jgi:hypothetical protein
MRAPTVQRLQDTLGIDADKADTIRALIRGEVHPGAVWGGDAGYLRSCYHKPHMADRVLHAIDAILDTCGIEGWANPDDGGRSGVSYCNTGEAYAPTVYLITDWRGRRFGIGSWGDLVEHKMCGADRA